MNPADHYLSAELVIAEIFLQFSANCPFLKRIFVLPTISVDNSVDNTGDEAANILSHKGFFLCCLFIDI